METQISCSPAYARGAGRAQQRNSGLSQHFCLEKAAPSLPPLTPDAAVPPLMSLAPLEPPPQHWNSEFIWDWELFFWRGKGCAESYHVNQWYWRANLKQHDKLWKRLPQIGLWELSFFVNKQFGKSQFPVGIFTVVFMGRKYSILEIFLPSINSL